MPASSPFSPTPFSPTSSSPTPAAQARLASPEAVEAPPVHPPDSDARAMETQPMETQPMETLAVGTLRRVHHIALNVQDMQASRQFYGTLLGLRELVDDEVPSTLKEWVAQGKVLNFVTPDGTVIDLFGEPELSPPASDPRQQFTRANHLAFDIAPEQFDQAVAVLINHQVVIDHGPVTRPTGRGIYFYDPDGFLVEIRCGPA